MSDILVPAVCKECGAKTDPANVHFMTGKDGKLQPTYECLECKAEYPIRYCGR